MTTSNSLKLLRSALTIATLLCFLVAGGLLLRTVAASAQAKSPVPNKNPWTTKAIEEIAVGDMVLARDEDGSELAWKPVKEIYRRTSYHLRHLTFRDATGRVQTFETTDEHPYWSETAKAFVNAGDLQLGERVTNAPPSEDDISSVRTAAQQTLIATHRVEHPEGIIVHNFQVDDFHTYFVAARGATGPPVLVHNADYVEPGSLYGIQGRSEFSGNKIKRFKKQMMEGGYDHGPIEIAVVDGRNIILDGHHRARAAGAAGITHVPVVIKEVSEARARELLQQAAEAAQNLGLEHRW